MPRARASGVGWARAAAVRCVGTGNFMGDQDRKVTVKQTFDDVASGYDGDALRFFARGAQHLATLLNLQGDEQVLDIATGTGSAALEVARRLPDGCVLGVDFAPAMLAQARSKARAARLDNVEFRELDMQGLDLPDRHYDAALCAFGIFFVEDMQRQLVRIADKVKPGGQVAISGFHHNALLPMIESFFLRLRRYAIEPPSSSWRRIDTVEKALTLFGAAGLEQVRVEVKDVGYYLKNAAEWWDIIWYTGYRDLVARLAPGDLRAFRADHLREVQALATQDGIWLGVEVLFAIGVRP